MINYCMMEKLFLFLAGSAKVGKTSIVRRFLHNEFTEAYLPTIEDFHRKIYKIHNDVYQLDVLDTSGIHPFPAMRRLSFLTGELTFVFHRKNILPLAKEPSDLLQIKIGDIFA